MKKTNKKEEGLVVYQTKTGAIELRGDLQNETVWATQAQIVKLFGVHQSVVSRHINNLFKDGEIDKKSNMQKMHIANSDKPVIFYSLDVVLGVGYRTNSKIAISFRQWATKTLRSYIVNGYAINRSRIAVNYDLFLKAVDDVKALLPVESNVDSKDILELITAFSETWLSLDAYDKDLPVKKGLTKKAVRLTAEKLSEALGKFKIELIKKGEATDIFGIEREAGNVSGIVGNVMQSFGGQAVYPTVEEKAAHLLYFMVKNHPFIDGNKRNGAYVFVWFLQKAGILNKTKITPPALTALTLLVAESNPKNKDRMVQLILQLLKK